MKRKTLATLLVLAFLVVLMIWSFGSSAANNAGRNSPIPAHEREANQIFANQDQEEQEPDVDADLGKHAGRIDREEYLRARGEYIARKRGIEPGRPFNPELRGQAIDQMERQEKGRRLESLVSGGGLTPASGGAWTPIGPFSISNGQALQPNTDTAVSGRVTAVVVDPTNANNVYLGTAQGGVWRSTDGGTTWASIFDGAQTQAIGALAVAPSDPSRLFVGTGEYNGCLDCFFGSGLYRIDGANSGSPSLVGPINPVQTVGSITYTAGIFNGLAVTKIVVDPTNADNLFVTSAIGVGGSGGNAISNSVPPLGIRGLWRSTNATGAAGAVTFQKLISDTDNFDTTDVVIEPGVPNNLLVAVKAANSPIYRSTNALAATPSFTQVYTSSTNARIQLAINKVGSVVTAYAATSETPTSTPNCTSPGSGAVRKQVDPFNSSATSTWSTQLTGGGGFCSTQCFYDITIAVNPLNAGEVYLGGGAGNGAGSGGNQPCGNGMKKSIDGGATFFRDQIGLHADAHALFFDGPGATVYAGNDGGIWKKAANNTAETAWTNLNTAPLNTLQFESIAVHPTDQFLMIGATQDNGTEYQQTSSGNWKNAEGGDGGYCLIDTSATDSRFVNMYHTFFNKSGIQLGFDRAVDANCLPQKNFWPARGAGFFVLVTSDDEDPTVSCDGTTNYLHNGLSLTDNVLFYAPMALGPGAPNTVYFGTDRLYRSTDRGDHMTVVSQASITSPGGNGSPISSIAIWPGGDNVRMIGTQNGQVWATANGSSTLVNLNPPLPANPAGGTNKFIGRAMIDPNNKNAAYVTLSYYAPAGQGIWKITNLSSAAVSGGATPNWVVAGSGIPSIPINAFAIDPQNSNNLYAGTDIGVYFSNDAGASWAPFGTGLPRSAVFDLKIQPSNRVLRAATHGRGVWETALVSPGANTVQFATGASSVNENTVSLTVTVTRSGDTSFPALVNYATSDSAGATGCSALTSSASARCNYIATLGTLNFAANETSKTISIPIISNSYVQGPLSFSVSLSNAGGLSTSVGSPGTTTITINDNGFAGPNQIDTSSFFVREQYVDFLNREPDTAGLNFWIGQMTNCGNPDLNVCRINVSAAFFQSIEFQDTGFLVYRIYKTAFGDDTKTSTLGGTAHNLFVPIIRLNQFLPDTQKIGQGVVVGVGNWQQQLENNKVAFAEEFVQRPAFLAPYPLTMTPAQFVDALNAKAASGAASGAVPPATRDQLVSDLTAGIKTRAQVLRAIAENQNMVSAEKNRAFVLMQYFGYLRRNPNDPPDIGLDYTGYEFWLTKLNQAGGNFVSAEMVNSFLVSDEYRRRFAGN